MSKKNGIKLIDTLLENKVFILSLILWVVYIWGGNFVYTKDNIVIAIGLGLLNLILVLLEQLHNIYRRISTNEECNIKYDISIINMYVKVIKNLVLILGIIAILFCLTLYIPIVKDII